MKGIGIFIIGLFCFVNLQAQVDLHSPGLPQITEPAALALGYQHIIQTPYFEDFATRIKNNFDSNTFNTNVQSFQKSHVGLYFVSEVNADFNQSRNLFLPAYTQGIFCDFEDHINRKRQLRIDFSVK